MNRSVARLALLLTVVAALWLTQSQSAWATTVDFTGSSSGSGDYDSGSTVTLSGPGGVTGNCTTNLRVTPTLTRNATTRVMSGYWTYTTKIVCDSNQRVTSAYGQAKKNSVVVQTSTKNSCDSGLALPRCASATSSGKYSCSNCAGTWVFDGNTSFDLDPTYVVTGLPPGCTRSGTSVSCVVHSATFRV